MLQYFHENFIKEQHVELSLFGDNWECKTRKRKSLQKRQGTEKN